MENTEQIKQLVKQKYSQIALQSKEDNQASCCGAGECSTEVYNIMTDDYSATQGYQSEADLGLGCGIPTEFAKIEEGDTVIDLGSGAGNDAFVARNVVGADGRVIGIDFTPAMIEKAIVNAHKLGFTNVEFREGDIENMPVMGEFADVVISNCVLNLVPNKDNVFKEIFRVLKSGGHFSISDVVLVGELPEALKSQAELYAGCVSGAIQRSEYLQLIIHNGFANLQIQKEKEIILPDDILSKYMNEEEINNYKKGATGIYSITVYAEKPSACGCGTNCC